MKQGVIFIIGLILLTDICDTIGQLLLKKSINAAESHIDSVVKALRLIMSLARVPLAWLSLACSVTSLGIWLFVLSKSDLNFAYSVDSMRYILITLASVMILKEKTNALRWAGVSAVVVGIILVATG